MNVVKTSFLSLLDGAYSALLNMSVNNSHVVPIDYIRATDKRLFQAPFLELKATADTQALKITALEAQIKYLQGRVNRLDELSSPRVEPRRFYELE